MSTKTITPPAGYPGTEWRADEHDPFWVPPHLRAVYAATEATEEMHATAIPRGVGVAPYTKWAHMHRLRAAHQHQTSKLRAAQDEARKTPCPVCGQRLESYQMVKVRTGRRYDTRVSRAVPEVVHACADCAPVLTVAMLGATVLPDGRTRAAAAAAFADDWANRDIVGVVA
ncbi:hypothetical protein [Cellulosimicrobium sp. NPDC055967]|uniref:hypothetical protein n=1 Tax=Cellulosimicrobium sp. NPDC055967 TaxID=3345670 RepID=UPI0035D6473D